MKKSTMFPSPLWRCCLLLLLMLQWNPVVVVVQGFRTSPINGGVGVGRATTTTTQRIIQWHRHTSAAGTATRLVSQPLAGSSWTRSTAASSSSSSPAARASAASITAAASTRSSTSTTSLHMMHIDMKVAEASLSATAKLLSSIGLGGLAAAKPGLLDAAAISALSRLTYWIFQPAFLFCSVSKTMYTAATTTGGLSLRALCLMPALAVSQIALGSLVGLVLSRLVAADSDADEAAQAAAAAEARNVRMCCTFGNSGPLPLIFADALFAGNPLLQSQVAAGISFYLLAWSPLFWTFGKVILNDDVNEKPKGNGNFGTAAVTAIRKIMSPPVVGSLAGLVVGLVGPLRQTMLSSNGLFRPVFGALATLGTAYLPAALLVLAGSLVGKKAAPPPAKTFETDNEAVAAAAAVAASKPSSSSSPSLRGLLAIAFARFVVSPALSWTVARFLIQGATWMDGRTAAIVTFLCLMEGCMPPAQNSVILLQLAGKTEAAGGMAKLLTLLYGTSVVPVTFLLTACLSKSGILSFL